MHEILVAFLDVLKTTGNWISGPVMVLLACNAFYKWIRKNASEETKEALLKIGHESANVIGRFVGRLVAKSLTANPESHNIRHIFSSTTRWIRTRLLTNQSPKAVFTAQITRSISARRAKQILFLLSILLLVLPKIGFQWPLIIPIVLLSLDRGIVIYRQRRGLFGDNELEFGEAVRHVLAEQRSGHGPGHFSRVFPEQISRTENVNEAVSAPIGR